MSKPYVSSITTKYGDIDRVRSDIKTLHEILSRQGSSLLIDVIAESCGNVANKFDLSPEDCTQLVKSLVIELEESLKERI